MVFSEASPVPGCGQHGGASSEGQAGRRLVSVFHPGRCRDGNLSAVRPQMVGASVNRLALVVSRVGGLGALAADPEGSIGDGEAFRDGKLVLDSRFPGGLRSGTVSSA